MTYKDVMTIEGADGYEVETDQEYFAAIQRQINEGQWSLQGSHGRTMMAAIDAGACMLGKTRARDYYGNMIPARTDVQPGTKGSKELVAARYGADWANAMEAL